MTAQTTRTIEEKERNLLMLVGDLPKELRKRRALQERCWTSEKCHIAEYYIPAPPCSGFVVQGTNGTVVFAMVSAAVLPAYVEAHAVLACNSAKVSWNQRIKDLRLRRHALDLREYIEAIGRKDADLASAAQACVQRIDHLIPSLPEVIPPAEVGVPPTPAPRPGKEAPQVLLYDIKAPVAAAAAAEEGDSFELWTCNATDRKSRWAASRREPIVARRGTVPCLAFNETHVAILWQPHGITNPCGFWLALHELTAAGRIAKKSLLCWELSFVDAEGFINDGIGLISMSLSAQGILCVACSNAVLVCTLLGEQAGHTRAVVLQCDYKRNITCARLCELDMLVIGTACGECYEINWRHKPDDETAFSPQVEHILACEPIYDAYTSNRRMLLQTTLAMSGRLLPYICQDFVYMPSGRILASAVCGTLIFALEKYGQLLVYSTTARSIMYPFKAPPDVMGYAGGTTAKSLISYPGVHAACERVVVAYPGGLVRVLQINPKMAREIAMTKDSY